MAAPADTDRQIEEALDDMKEALGKETEDNGGGGSGPITAAAAASAMQKKEALLQRVDTNIASLVDNFSALVNISRVNDQPVQNSQELLQMEMRAAKITQAAESLLKLVSELKQTTPFSGFAPLNENVDQRTAVLNQEAENTDRLLERIGEEAAVALKELEYHYYSSVLRSSDPE